MNTTIIYLFCNLFFIYINIWSRLLDNDDSSVDLSTGNSDIDVNQIVSTTLVSELGTFSSDITCQNITVSDTLTATTAVL